jgi:pimeloyl-ACP methyl ester carboxylesterase
MIDWHGAAQRVTTNHKYGGADDHHLTSAFLPSVSCPTLVLYPDRSSIFAVEQSTAFYSLLPRGELAVFPKCGHNTYDQRPEDYIRTVLDFLRRTTKGEQDRTARPAMTCLA